jgi:hypothetical protein
MCPILIFFLMHENYPQLKFYRELFLRKQENVDVFKDLNINGKVCQ